MITQITPEIHSIEFSNFGSIVYLVQLEKEKILIDTSSKDNEQELIQSLKKLNLEPKNITTIILTHEHYDHVENIDLFPNAKIYAENIKDTLPIEKFKLGKIISWDNNPMGGRELVEAGNQKSDIASHYSNREDSKMRGMAEEKPFKIYKTPGHSQTDIIILYKNILFSGDVIFHHGYIGRTDFPESSPEKMQKALEFIKTLKFDILCPGH